ncbi:hypothetical protein [Mycoplasmopsis californica]|uniref:hypothetical protein n=1 Tax=Mycoplasmopsis californica TaxID=2113 RepID=UPI0005975AE5|nr:hypothetical protein [Mycoplasmopsis californica]
MSKLLLKAYNYYPDFSNENIAKIGTEIIDGIKFKTVDGFENFGFHELALNFSNQNIEEIKKLAKNIVSTKTTDIIIFTDLRTEQNYRSGYEFVYSNDLLLENKIRFHFILSDSPQYVWFQRFESLKTHLNWETTSFIFAKLHTFNTEFIEYIKIILNYLQQHHGYWRTLNKSYLIGKENVELQLDFIEISENNKLISPNILEPRYAFFAEINLLLLFLKGVDIAKVLQGYVSGSNDFTSNLIGLNQALQYAYICSILANDKKRSLLISSDPAINSVLTLYSKLKNEQYINKNRLCATMQFPEHIYTYAPYTIAMSNIYYATFVQLNSQRHDYRITPELSINDGVDKFKQNRLSEFNHRNNDGIVTTLSSVANVPLAHIILEQNGEIELGILVAFFYWSNIFEAYLNKINPFEI